MFVIIEAWNNLSAVEKQNPLPERVALAMKHAGVSITVTSVTDFVAFAIGATTVCWLTLSLYFILYVDSNTGAVCFLWIKSMQFQV